MRVMLRWSREGGVAAQVLRHLLHPGRVYRRGRPGRRGRIGCGGRTRWPEAGLEAHRRIAHAAPTQMQLRAAGKPRIKGEDGMYRFPRGRPILTEIGDGVHLRVDGPPEPAAGRKVLRSF